MIVGILTMIGSDATFAKANDPATECLIELRGADDAVLGSTLACKDGDACDGDGATNGSCSVKVKACVNFPSGSCQAQALKKVKVNPKKVGISVAPNGTSSVCGAFTSSLTLKLRKNNTKASKPKKLSASAKGQAKKVNDADKVKVTCEPCPTASCVPTTTTTLAVVTTTSTSTSTTTTTLACGNGVVDPGEACDPDVEAGNGCGGGTPFCSADCTACQANCSSLAFKIGPPAPACGFPADGIQDPAVGTCSTTVNQTCSADGDCPVGETCAQLTGDIKDAADMSVPAGRLAAGCLYIGGGLASIVPPGPTPENGQSIMDVADCSGDAITLAPSAGHGGRDCTLGPTPNVKRCLNGHPGSDGKGLCTSDAQCMPLCVNGQGTACSGAQGCTCVNGPGNGPNGTCEDDSNCGQGITVNACQPEARCVFGDPLPFVNDPTSTCVINAIQDGASGSATKSTGEASLTLPLQSRVYLTGITYGVATPCPKCVNNVCSGGKRAGQPCATTNSLLTTHDCPPDDNLFLAPLAVNLSPLTTGTASDTDPNGLFCSEVGQDDTPPGSAGALGVKLARTIVEVGSPTPGPLSLTPQPMTLASVFCIPEANSTLVDAAANLPGPGATALSGEARLR